MRPILRVGLAVLCSLGCFALLGAQRVRADSATWNAHPASDSWRAPKNWTPFTVPNSETDTGTFGVSDVTTIYIGREPKFLQLEVDVAGITFGPDANRYTILVAASHIHSNFNILTFYGAGVINNSAETQHFVVEAGNRVPGRIYFQNTSAVDDNVVITCEGGEQDRPDNYWGAFLEFGFLPGDAPSAGNATYVNQGGRISGTLSGGFTNLIEFTKVGAATFINEPGGVSGAAGGHTYVATAGTLGEASFINNPATIAGAEGGSTEIDSGICAGTNFVAGGASVAGPQAGQVYVYGGSGYAYFIAKGGSATGADGGFIHLSSLPNSPQTIVTAEGGVNGGTGGFILVGKAATLDQSQFEVLGNGIMNLSDQAQDVVTVGSLSGDGTVINPGMGVSIGGNDLSTIFSGVISGMGTVTKVGVGALTLSGNNTYTGSTSVNAGILGGSGSIAGELIVGTGNSSGATLAPAAATNGSATFTTKKGLIFQADGIYSCLISDKGDSAASDEVVADSVTINSGAQFVLTSQVTDKLDSGTTFTVISDTAAAPISGTFANLADGSSVTIGSNTFQANYEGGDGNDLTLTVVQ